MSRLIFDFNLLGSYTTKTARNSDTLPTSYKSTERGRGKRNVLGGGGGAKRNISLRN